MSPMISAAVVGARGYAGLELIQILARHPRVKLGAAFASESFDLAQDLFDAPAIPCLPATEIEAHACDIVFLATPAETSLNLAPKLVACGRRVVDLSGAFRLKETDATPWYGFTSGARQLNAHYGLIPLANPPQRESQIIANPGCFATAIAMALIPLLRRGFLEPRTLVIDAKSGTTGAGRPPRESTAFASVSEDCVPYRIGRHQHLPEIEECVRHLSGVTIDPQMVTHLLPAKRGISAGIYARTKVRDVAQITKAYLDDFSGYPLVRFGAADSRLARLSSVVRTPYTHLTFELVGDKLYLFSCLDNLLKGAASQAVENMNAWFDLPAHMGLGTGAA